MVNINNDERFEVVEASVMFLVETGIKNHWNLGKNTSESYERM